MVEYGADKNGFQPSGEGITVPPPTTVDETRFREEPDYAEEEERVQPQRPYVRVSSPFKLNKDLTFP